MLLFEILSQDLLQKMGQIRTGFEKVLYFYSTLRENSNHSSSNRSSARHAV